MSCCVPRIELARLAVAIAREREYIESRRAKSVYEENQNLQINFSIQQLEGHNILKVGETIANIANPSKK